MNKNKNTVTGFLTRGKGYWRKRVSLFLINNKPEMITNGWYSRINSYEWDYRAFNRQYTCKGFKLQPGDCILVEMEL